MKAKRSEEERAAWYDSMRALAAKVSAMEDGERQRLADELGTVTAEGRPLSAFNTVFLANQAGRVLAQVGGFRQWQKAGRMVKKGEHAAGRIWVPTGARDAAEGEADGNGNGRRRFVLVPVFDVTQTEPAEAQGGAA